MKAKLIVLGVMVSVAVAGSAAAQPKSQGELAEDQRAASMEAERKKAEKEQGPGEGDTDYGHQGQVGLRVGVYSGMNMVFRYDNTAYCEEPPSDASKEPRKFCGFAMPPVLDVGLSFAPLDSIEPFLWARFGLKGEKQTNTDKVMLFGVGARIYTMADSSFKIFVQPAVAWETESGGDNPDWSLARPGDKNGDTYAPAWKKDLVFHLSAGPQFDFAQAVGMYVDAGLSTGVLRGIHTSMEIGLGLQVRVP